jgi:poly-gamma-glutamate capsule biosynthesis protein CapA/YwtB (metallophosphatase superfamily)
VIERLAALLLFVGAAYAQSTTGIHIFLTGDSILNRRLSVYQDTEYKALFDKIRSADAGFTNFETLIHHYELAGAAVSGGAYQTSPPWIVDELKWAGLKLLSVANNHAFDYGEEGMRSTLNALDAAGLAHAGAGENLAFARAPAYVDTRHGRIALVACASTFTPGSQAGEQRPDLRGRPGICPLRFTTVYTVDAPTLAVLRGLPSAGGRGGGSGVFRLGGAVYEEGAKKGARTEMVKQDADQLVRSIREARRQADFVIVSIHAHEGRPENRQMPADFLAAFAHAAVDAGADVFVGHGPHVLRPVEIYKGKPIFYSMANFAFENETMQFQPAESFEEAGLPESALPGEYFDERSKNDTRGFPVDRPIWESVVAELKFRADRSPAEILVYPITLGFGESRAQRGRPRPASAEDGKRVVEGLAAISAPLGTKIEYRDGHGVVVLGR